MNERIRELEAQCWELQPSWTGVDKRVFNSKKFAELIVRETLMQMAIQMDNFGDAQANNPTWYKSEEAVKQYFNFKYE
jgi:hypothetical protein